ncbi:LysE/ArgO family amino acid transporter [Saccharospirillum alexandrii]|uniref:LysE/ArgO family amino acid transporter n=1 Tax=Saccharospirillum alexandrii TaxID=2448477 RepID=UPI000FD8322A|nr:LysE family transporter [Saccharospirillum alexandrii]
MVGSFITGFGISIGLIVAIGAQNAWVLNKSMRGEHPAVVALVCCSIDALLITLGVYSVDWVQQRIPGLVPVLTWLGICLLCWLAAQAFWRVWHGSEGLRVAVAGAAVTKWQVAGQAMAISLLNPHVYLDTVVLVGSVGAQQSYPGYFVVGAAAASATWFFSLTGFGRYLGPKLRSPTAWRWFDATVGGVMVLVAVSLVP